MNVMRMRVLFRHNVASSLLRQQCIQSHRAISCVCTQNKRDSFPWNAMALVVAVTAVSTASSVVYAEEQKQPPVSPKSFPIISRHTVKQHTSESKGIWVTHNEGVYDLTSFIANHPGGKDKILLAGGRDLSELWQQLPFQLHYRSPLALELLEEYRIGTLPSHEVQEDHFMNQPTAHLQESERIYSNKRIYECIVVGAGLAGLQCANTLLQTCGDEMTNKDVLILEASDYVGGRVKQVDSFVSGIPIDVGAEFLHGTNTLLAKTAIEHGDPLKELFCWAQGDGGPLPEAADNGGFGLYYFGGSGGDKQASRGGKCKERLLRFDDQDADFVRMNNTLSGISSLDEKDFADDVSLHDYLVSKNFSDEMLAMAEAGFSNTMCTNSRDLSLKQSIRWGKFWDEEEGDDGDYVFIDSFKNVINRLKENIQIELNMPVVSVQHPQSGDDLDLIKLTAADGTNYYTKNVVITAPPPVIASKIKFSPPLSEKVNEALESVLMHDVVKVFLKFSEPVWPQDLHGIIMAGNDDFLVPEVWFKDIDPLKVDPTEPARGLAICYTTADFTKRLSALPKEEVLQQVLGQLDHVFSMLEVRHMSATGTTPVADNESPVSVPVCDVDKNDKSDKNNTPSTHSLSPMMLKKPSEVYLGGMFWDWNAQHHPYITGGYCSPLAGKNPDAIALLAKPYSHEVVIETTKEKQPLSSVHPSRVFFAGEATSVTAGATAHAAMGSGMRAAAQVAKNIQTSKYSEE